MSLGGPTACCRPGLHRSGDRRAARSRHRAGDRRRQRRTVVADDRQPGQRGKRHHRRRRQPAAQRAHPQARAVRTDGRQPVPPVPRRADGVLQLARTRTRTAGPIPMSSRTASRTTGRGLGRRPNTISPRLWHELRVTERGGHRCRAAPALSQRAAPGRFETRSSRPPIPRSLGDGSTAVDQGRGYVNAGAAAAMIAGGHRARPAGPRRLQRVRSRSTSSGTRRSMCATDR